MNGFMADKKLMEINSQVFSEILKFKIWAEIAYSNFNVSVDFNYSESSWCNDVSGDDVRLAMKGILAENNASQ